MSRSRPAYRAEWRTFPARDPVVALRARRRQVVG